MKFGLRRLLQAGQRLAPSALCVAIALTAASCTGGHGGRTVHVQGTATPQPTVIQRLGLTWGESSADIAQRQLNALTWTDLDVKLGWHALHPGGSQFVRDFLSRQVYDQPPLYLESYADVPPNEQSNVNPSMYFGPADIHYVEGPDVKPGYEDVAGAVWTEQIVGFSVRIHQFKSSVSGFFPTGQTLNGTSVEARVDARNINSLRDFVTQLVTDR